MTVLFESVEVRRDLADTFNYVSDFSTCQEWDPTVKQSRQLSDGPVNVGTCFEVICALPVGKVTLIYEVTAFRLNELFEQRGRSWLFDIQDTIRFEQSAGGTRIDYQAEIFFKPWLKPLAACSRRGLEKMGREAVQGMVAALSHDVTVSP